MVGEMLKITTDELDRLINANTLMGDPIDAGDKTIIPIAGFGFGFGSGEGQAGEGSGQGAGAGAGGGVNPVAIIIIHKDVKGPEGVQVLSLKKSSAISEVISTIGEAVLPQVVGAISRRFEKTEKEEREKQAEEEPAGEV
jgi:uncharacterized spore protein YtfJ